MFEQLKYKIGRSLIKFGAQIISIPNNTVEIHELIPNESPFTKLGVILIPINLV